MTSSSRATQEIACSTCGRAPENLTGFVSVADPGTISIVMGDIGKPIRETERPAPVRTPAPDFEPEPQPTPPPPQPEPEPVEAQRA